MRPAQPETKVYCTIPTRSSLKTHSGAKLVPRKINSHKETNRFRLFIVCFVLLCHIHVSTGHLSRGKIEDSDTVLHYTQSNRSKNMAAAATSNHRRNSGISALSYQRYPQQSEETGLTATEFTQVSRDTATSPRSTSQKKRYALHLSRQKSIDSLKSSLSPPTESSTAASTLTWFNSYRPRMDTHRFQTPIHPTIPYQYERTFHDTDEWPSKKRHKLDQQRLQEIWMFGSVAIRRHKLSIDPVQIYLVLYEWEATQLNKQIQLEKENQARLERQRTERARNEEYYRHLRLFASQIAKTHVRKVNQARNFDEFRKLLFNPKEEDPPADLGTRLPRLPLLVPRLEYPIEEEPNVVVSTSSKLHLPGVTGGGVWVKSPRSVRAVGSMSTDSDNEESTGNQEDNLDKEPSYSEDGLRNAFESYLEFKQTACHPRNLTLCTLRMLDLPIHHTRLAIPPGFHVQRCTDAIPTSTCSVYASQTTEDSYAMPGYPADHGPSSCSCDSPDEECLPSKVGLLRQAVAVIEISPTQQPRHSTELVVITNHLSCQCQPRCENRLCIPPLLFVKYTLADCGCVCGAEDKRCHDLLEGKATFTPAEIPLPLNGSYILPPCRHGIMNDVHLYHRRCPREHQPGFRAFD